MKLVVKARVTGQFCAGESCKKTVKIQHDIGSWVESAFAYRQSVSGTGVNLLD